MLGASAYCIGCSSPLRCRCVAYVIAVRDTNPRLDFKADLVRHLKIGDALKIGARPMRNMLNRMAEEFFVPIGYQVASISFNQIRRVVRGAIFRNGSDFKLKKLQ